MRRGDWVAKEVKTAPTEDPGVGGSEEATVVHWVDEARMGEPVDSWDQVVTWGYAAGSKEVHATRQHKCSNLTWVSIRDAAPKIYLGQTGQGRTCRYAGIRDR